MKGCILCITRYIRSQKEIDNYSPTNHSPRHIHVPILPMPRRLPHLHLELRARVPAVHRHAAPRREAVGPVDGGLLLLVAAGAVAVWRRGLGVVRCRRRRRASGPGLFALELGPRRGRLRLDLLKGRGLGDDVLEKLEVVVVRDGVGWSGEGGLVGGMNGERGGEGYQCLCIGCCGGACARLWPCFEPRS